MLHAGVARSEAEQGNAPAWSGSEFSAGQNKQEQLEQLLAKCFGTAAPFVASQELE